jgi:cytochrome P450
MRHLFNGSFTPKLVQARMAQAIATQAHLLIDQFSGVGHVDLKTAFADRLALWTVMTMLGLPLYDFTTIRGWFTDMAHALGNFAHDPQVRHRGCVAALTFGAYAAPHMERLRSSHQAS